MVPSSEVAGPAPSANLAVPKLSGGWPLLGNLVEFVKNPVSTLGRGRDEHGELVKFRLGTRDVVLFSGTDAHDFYFQTPEEELNAKAVYQFTVPIFGRGVAYDVSPELMSEQLGFLYPALRGSPMRKFATLMYDEIRMFADQMGDEGVINLPYAMNELTVNIASRCLLGPEVRSRLNSEFAEAYHELQNGINTLGFFLPNFPSPKHRSRDRARKCIAELFTGIMTERRRTGARHDDFMQALMDAHYKDGRSLSDDEITGILLTALFAGHHTSAVLATWICLELLQDHVYVSLIRDELNDVYSPTGAMTLDTLKVQVMLERAVRECERLHPPLIILVRKVLKTLHYKDYVIPAGTLAMVSPAVSHRLPHLFVDPHRFNPHRFAPPDAEDRQHRYTLIGFGGGKHICMGKHFAIMQLKAIWSVLLDRFDFHSESEIPAPDYRSWVTGPKLPCTVRYSRRSQSSVFQ
ncbi:MAG: cytochrome P450 [Acidiferrobacterales bacterium]|nr:cytochrome P450 [Acidiferrobacterales bacterium]